MIAHEEARALASVRFDGELALDDLPRLEEHLRGCPDCRAFAAALDGLRTAILAVPRVSPSQHVIQGRISRTRRVVAMVAAALSIAVAFVSVPIPAFDLPEAQAAEALTRISTMYVERTIEQFEGTPPRASSVIREKIWFRAPASIRIERSGFDRSGAIDELILESPGRRYRRTAAGATLTRNLPPDAMPLPEPLSTTVTAIGEPLGQGPVIAGRSTIRFLAEVRGERRVVFADAQRFAVIGVEPTVILGKQDLALRTVKTTRVVRYNAPIESTLFRIQDALTANVRREDGGFRRGPAFTRAVGAPRIPEGFRLLQEGSAREDRDSPPIAYAQYGKGALRILVTVGDFTTEPEVESRAVEVGGRPGSVFTSLYEAPFVQFELSRKTVTVSADLPPDALVELASKMFPV